MLAVISILYLRDDRRLIVFLSHFAPIHVIEKLMAFNFFCSKYPRAKSLLMLNKSIYIACQ